MSTDTAHLYEPYESEEAELDDILEEYRTDDTQLDVHRDMAFLFLEAVDSRFREFTKQPAFTFELPSVAAYEQLRSEPVPISPFFSDLEAEVWYKAHTVGVDPIISSVSLNNTTKP